MKRRFIILSCLLCFVILIIMPPLIYSYVYPNGSDDTAFHLIVFDKIAAHDETLQTTYFGQYITGYILVGIKNILGISLDTSFLWFNFGVLILSGLSIALFVGNIVDWRAGLLSIPVTLFATGSTMVMFNNGSIFDIATVGILLPLFLLCLVKAINHKKWYWFVGIVVLGISGLLYHSAGIFGNKVVEGTPSLVGFLLGFVGISIIILLVASGVIIYSKKRAMNKQTKVAIYLLSGVVGILAVLGFSGVVGFQSRIAMDLAIVISILAVVVWGVSLKANPIAAILLTLLLIPSILGGLIRYEQNNSAIKDVDKEAIAYINQLPGNYYSCSPTVAPWIYGRYLNKSYKTGAYPYIYRNKSMTYMVSTGGWSSDNETYGYRPESGMIPINGAIYQDGDLIIIVENK